MFLKSIRAQGFKSFADKTELDLNKGITCVVGPNGSGKSNILDALRWVLGEQSVKALRGDNSMIDVIFTGSKSRNPSNRASVSLTFDNSDHYLNSEFSELEIKRVVYKSGENEYYINNTKVRLKDITDLFLDSGAGKESFNIISQGAVADIINSKSNERRTIFEEAAGVLKYKRRKEESLHKLDKTNENLARIKLLIDELQTTLTPLKEESEKAQKYLSYKEELQNIEVALIATDIKNINNELENTKKKINNLTIELDDLHSSNSEETTKTEKLKLENLKLDEEIEEKTKKLNDIISRMSSLETKKQITIERQKYEVDESKLQNNIIMLKEEVLNLEKTINEMDSDIKNITEEITEKNKEYQTQKEKYDKKNQEQEDINSKLNTLNKEILNITNRIEIIKDNLENDAKVPEAIRSILNNTRLKGIEGILSKLIETEDKYMIALDTALGSNNNVVVTKNENNAKEAINYLKENRLGRVTFYPISVIKPREVLANDIKKIENITGYINTFDNLVKYKKDYENIIKNQLGNVIVVNDIDTMNLIGKTLEYKYKIVTLEGEVLYAGGAITGGTRKNNNSIINQKIELEKLEEELKNKEETISILTKNKDKITNNLTKISEQITSLEKDIVLLRETANLKENTLKETKTQYSNKQNELNGTQNIINNSLDKELDDILKEYYDISSEKDLLTKEITKLKNNKSDIVNELGELENTYREYNYNINLKQNELKNEEIKASKYDVKLDNLLQLLNENYSMTYEKASREYNLDVEEGTARLTVSNLKARIKDLGNVNTGSIAEYERINTRYTFLNTQKDDLETSVTGLLEVIEEMDELMKTKFLETFNKIALEFKTVFKTLFKGGEGILKLTEPNDLLNTGIEIEAIPPGKKLNSLALLSGGEKTLTAISLLFAILNVKTVPFVVLDEVEAALDDANVDSFGKYLLTRKEKSQFIIITHKKRTMEYADVLYGITMQESGVSKLVSVKLES